MLLRYLGRFVNEYRANRWICCARRLAKQLSIRGRWLRVALALFLRLGLRSWPLHGRGRTQLGHDLLPAQLQLLTKPCATA
jgi:hypothetical protein